MKPKMTWLLFPISLGAFVATWGGWAKLASMTGYTETVMFPGHPDWSTFNTGIVLPLTVEPFGALAMAVAFNVKVRRWARVISGLMAITTLVMAGVCQAVVHSLTVKGLTVAPDLIVSFTSVLPVVVLGLGGALAMLNAARTPDAETTHGTTRVGFLGRIGTALGDAAASQAERLAAASQTTRDATQRATQTSTQDDPGTAGSSTRVVPTQPSQPKSGTTQPSVPAAQGPKPDRDELIQKIAMMRLGTNPGTGKQWSYAQIGDELGISKSEAQRLGTKAEQQLPGTTDLTQEFFGTTRVNGFDHTKEVAQ